MLCLRMAEKTIEAKQTENKERKITLQTVFCDLNLIIMKPYLKWQILLKKYSGNVQQLYFILLYFILFQLIHKFRYLCIRSKGDSFEDD